MKIVFWGAIALLFFSYIGFALLVYAVAKAFKRNQWKFSREYIPTVTIIVSAYNEEEIIQEKMANLLELNYPEDKLDIIIASESTDNTNEIIENNLGGKIRLLAFSGRMGKSHTIYRVMRDVRSQIVVFSDANSMYEKDAIRELVKYFYNSSIGGVIGQLKYKITNLNSGTSGENVYWKIDKFFRLACNEFKGLVPGVNGSIFAIKRECYFPINEFRSDDYELPIKIVNSGYKVIYNPQAIAYESASESNSQQINRKIRIARWNFQGSLILLVDAISKRVYLSAIQIIFTRLIRYFAPFIHLLMLYTNYRLLGDGALYKALFALQLATISLGVMTILFSSLKNRFLLFIGYYLMMNYAAFMAVISSYKIMNMWEKQRK